MWCLLRKLSKYKRLLIYSIGKFLSKKRLFKTIGYLRPFNKIHLVIKKNQEYSSLFFSLIMDNGMEMLFFCTFSMSRTLQTPKLSKWQFSIGQISFQQLNPAQKDTRCSCFQSAACTTYNLSALPTIWGLKRFCNHILVNSVILMDILSSRLLKH